MSAVSDREPPLHVEMKDIALQYLMLGLSAIPVALREKRPALDNWALYSDRRPVPQEINKWWTMHPDWGVGITTGKMSKVVVIDCDDWDLSQQLLRRFPTPWVAISPGHNSYHLYYQYPSGHARIPNAKLFGGKVDFKADGGFIVAPPTIHPNGKRYVWHTKDGAYPAPLPLEILEMVVGKKTETSSDHWIVNLLENGSESGSRDQDATRLAGYFVKKGMARDVILLQLKPWFDQTEQDREFNWSNVVKCLDSVIKSHKRANPHSITEEVLGVTSVSNPEDHVTHFFDFIEGEDDEDEIKWLIKGWLPENSTALMVAPPGTYKTWLMIAMAVSVGCGVPFMGNEVSAPAPVLIIQQEDSKDLIKQRLRTVWGPLVGIKSSIGTDEQGDYLDFYNLTVEPHIDVKESDKLIHFDDPDSMELLKDLIVKYGYKLVFIDPLYMSADADNFMAKAAQQMGVLKRLRDAYGVTFVVLHHTKKSTAEDGIQRMDAWGSQFINAWLETGIQVRPTDIQNTVQVVVHFKNSENKKLMHVQFTIDTNPASRNFEMKVLEADTAHQNTDTKENPNKYAPKITDENIETILLENVEPMTAGEMMHVLKDKYSIDVSDRTVRDRLKRMAIDGVVIAHGDKTYSLTGNQ